MVFIHKLSIRLLKIISILGIVIIVWFVYTRHNHKQHFDDPQLPAAKFLNDTANNDFEISIIHPVFKGTNKNSAPYIIKADKTFKVSDDHYNLENINATYLLNDENLLILSSKGFIDDNSKSVTVSGNVRITSNTYAVSTEDMIIDLKNEEAKSASRTKINYKNSEITANNFDTKSNAIINFRGNVIAKIQISDFE